MLKLFSWWWMIVCLGIDKESIENCIFIFWIVDLIWSLCVFSCILLFVLICVIIVGVGLVIFGVSDGLIWIMFFCVVNYRVLLIVLYVDGWVCLSIESCGRLWFFLRRMVWMWFIFLLVKLCICMFLMEKIFFCVVN